LIKTKDFDLFTRKSQFTDDTVMTLAISKWLCADKDSKDVLIRNLKYFGNLYPNAGYGGRFMKWLAQESPEPYGSWGNGSAMRVSPCAWVADSLEEAQDLARTSAIVTHDHPEGVQGAESLAAVIFLARNKYGMDEIREYIVREFGYDLSRTVDEIRPDYHHVEDCMRTMPEAFECFLESTDYEDCIRNVVSIGGDVDTLGAIAGAAAEAFWGIPKQIVEEGDKFLTNEIREVVRRFYEQTGASTVI
jgi:ADP-ribosylglycohydrolase